MKKIILSLSLICVSLMSFAQSEAYNSTMQGLIMKMNQSTSPEMYVPVQNGFERIAAAEPKEWLPKYYVAYATILQAMFNKDTKAIDPMLDKADKILDEAAAISANNDEILVLQAFAKSARIGVDPMSRGAKYGGESAALLEKAKKINPENPRIYFLQAQSKFYTPEAFGGGKAKAKELFELAVAKYETFQPKNELMPTWGVEQARQMREICNQ